MADAPATAAPAALSDPAHLVRMVESMNVRINALEGSKQDLEKEVDVLRGQLAQQTSAASSARGAMKPMKEELQMLRDRLSASENLQELAQLRAQVAKLHKTIAEKDKATVQREEELRVKVAELTQRAGRAEAKFQALESTTEIMAKSRDKANEAAATMLAERDDAKKKAASFEEDLVQFRAEFVKVKADLEKAQAEAKALRQAPAPKAK